MIESKSDTNLLIDWAKGNKKARNQRKGYLQVLRKFLIEIDSLNNSDVTVLLNKWNVYFIDTDEFHRVNIDEPGDKR